jgi:hypothetical protein
MGGSVWRTDGKAGRKLKILVGHHPVEWLKDDNRRVIEPLITKNFDAHLATIRFTTRELGVMLDTGRLGSFRAG